MSLKKYLIVSLQGNGNAILSLPLAKGIKTEFPNAMVGLLVANPRIAKLCSEYSSLDKVFVANGFGLLKKIYQEKFDIALFAYPSAYKSHLIPWLARIPERAGHRIQGRKSFALTMPINPLHSTHDLDRNMMILKRLGIDFSIGKLWPPLDVIPEKFIKRAKDFLAKNGFEPTENYLGIHTGSDSNFSEKRYPPRHFARIARAIYESHGLKAIVFDGPAEKGTGKQVVKEASTPVLSLDGWGDLTDAWGLMGFCRAFLSNDSGIMNLAEAAGVPTVGVFGPSEAFRTRPYFGEYVKSDWECSPCFSLSKYPGCKFSDKHCMESISPLHVIEVLKRVLDK